MIYQEQSFSKILKKEYSEKLKINPRYSMRSFAKYLDISVSSLSDIFNNKQGMSPRRASAVASKLGYSESEKKYFVELAESYFSKSKKKRDESRKEVERIRKKYNSNNSFTINMKMFKVMSEWYHLAILELTYLDNFESNTNWISKALNVPETLIRDAVERLFELKLLIEEEGVWKDRFEIIGTTHDVPSKAIRKFHSSVLSLANNALEEQDVENREVSTVFFSFKKSELEKAKESLRKLRKEFADSLETEKTDSVYALNINFFEVTGRNL